MEASCPSIPVHHTYSTESMVAILLLIVQLLTCSCSVCVCPVCCFHDWKIFGEMNGKYVYSIT